MARLHVLVSGTAAALMICAAASVHGALPHSPSQAARPRPPASPPSGSAVPRDGTTPPTSNPSLGPVYRVRPPQGFLPWPQHSPEFTQDQYDQMQNSIFVLNNFPLYQGADTRDSVYFHDGLDIVLANGTPVYSLVRGTVRGILGNPPYYQSVVVEDAERPGWAWIYTHVQPDTATRIGTVVQQGTRIAAVRFEGIEHVHLTRTVLTPGGSWGDSFAHNHVDPTPFFHFEDTEAPAIETPFYYFLNESTKLLPRSQPTMVSGAVDVVAGIRDGGKYAKGRVPGWPPQTIYGDRNAPKRISIAIASADDPQRVLWSQVALDTENIVLRWRPGFPLRDPDRVGTVFAFRPETNPNGPRDNNAVFSYYFLTNRSRAAGLQPIDVRDGEPSWDTAAVDASGRPLFPDGEYIVSVTASDWKGNTRTVQDRVVVLNRR